VDFSFIRRRELPLIQPEVGSPRNGFGLRLSFWHEQGRHEVDFVIEHGREAVKLEDRLWAIPLGQLLA